MTYKSVGGRHGRGSYFHLSGIFSTFSQKGNVLTLLNSMLDNRQQNVTRLLIDARGGDVDVLDRLLPLVYEELRVLARRHLRRQNSGHTFQTTGLVHEVYLKLVDQDAIEWRDRVQFFALASRAMRHLLIDYARRKNAQKRGGERKRVTLDVGMLAIEQQAADFLRLEEELARLAEHDERMGRIVEYRFFGGMTNEEVAQALDVSSRTVERDWKRAKTYLYRALKE